MGRTGPEMSDLSIFPPFFDFFVGVTFSVFSFLSSFTLARWATPESADSPVSTSTHWHISTDSRPSCRNRAPRSQRRRRRRSASTTSGSASCQKRGE